MEMFHFLRPAWLLLLPLVALLVVMLARFDDSARPWRKWVAPHLLEALWVDSEKYRRFRPLSALGLVLVLSVVALAGPAWRQKPAPFTQDAASLVVVLEVTASMLTRDISPSRLERAKHKIHDLLEQRQDAKTALVAYAGSAHLVMPLTRDATLIDMFASELHPDVMPRAGEDFVSAIALAAGQLSAAGEKGSILWIGDGVPSDPSMSVTVSPGISILMLGMVSVEQNRSEFELLEDSAGNLGGRLVSATADGQDIAVIARRIERAFSGALGEESNLR